MAKKKKRKKSKVRPHHKVVSKVLTDFHVALRKAKREPGGATYDNIVKHMKPIR